MSGIRQGDQVITLISNGSSATDEVESYWAGGVGHFTAEATWGGGSAKLQWKTRNGTWIDYPSGSLSANGLVQFTLPPGTGIRVTVATATAVYAYAVAL